MKKIVVLQSNFFPWIGYFDLINEADIFIFYDEVKYTKNDWRNRNRIFMNNKLHWFGIPVSKESEKIKISEVSTEYDSMWRKSHLSLLHNAYKTAPFYEQQLKPFISRIYNLPITSLSELNQVAVIELCKMLNIKTDFLDSKKFLLNSGKIDRLKNLLLNFSPCIYISGPAGKDYLENSVEDFLLSGIKIQFYEYPKYNDYSSRVYQGESILDYLANQDVANFQCFLQTSKKRIEN